MKSQQSFSSQPIDTRTGSADLYKAQVTGAAHELSATAPVLELSTEVMHTLWSLGPKLAEFHLHTILLAHKAKLSKNTLKISDVQWHASAKPILGGQYGISVQHCAKSGLSMKKREITAAGIKEITAFHLQTTGQVLPVDFMQVCCYVIIEEAATLHFNRIWPSVSLTLTPISPLRVVSTELAIRLIKDKREETKFRSGFLTMDKAKRLILIRNTDPHFSELPLVGIWITGLSTSRHETPPNLLWAAATHYLLLPGAQKLSNDVQKLAFLLVLISASTTFYEVTKTESPGNMQWTMSMSSLTLTGTEPADMTVPLRFLDPAPVRQSSSSSGSDGHNSSTSARTSTESLLAKPQISTEELIREQTSVLQDLERQLKELKRQVFSTVPSEYGSRVVSPKPPKSGRVDHRKSTRLSLLIGPSKKEETDDQCAETDRGSEHYEGLVSAHKQSLGHLPRYSLPVSRRSPPREDVRVPLIEYQSESNSSEEEDHKC